MLISQSIYSTDLGDIVKIRFSDEQISDQQKLREILSYNENEIIFEELNYFYYEGKRIGYKYTYIIENQIGLNNSDFVTQLDVSRIRKWSNPKSASIQKLEKIHIDQFCIYNVEPNIRMKSLFMEWSSGGSADILSYDFSVQNSSIRHVYIQFFDIWNTFNSWQSKLDISMLTALPDDNPTHKLFQLIDHSVRNIELNFPHFGVFNDSNVRVREYPKLESVQLGKLNEGAVVRILEKSSEKMRIGDMNDYWYKIKTKEGLIGWSYGHFINLESNFDQSEVK